MNKQYAIKMDFKKWIVTKNDLTDGKIYPIYQDEFWYRRFKDDTGRARLCHWLNGWGRAAFLNTDIAFELNKYHVEKTYSGGRLIKFPCAYPSLHGAINFNFSERLLCNGRIYKNGQLVARTAERF